MGIVTAAAREAGAVIPLGAAVAQLLASLHARGDGGLDHSALLKLVEQLSGRGVLAFISNHHVGPDLAVELFWLDGVDSV